MIRAIIKVKHLFLLGGLALGMMALLACTSGSGTPISTEQSQGSQGATGTDLSQLLAAVNTLSESGALDQQISRSQVGGSQSNNTGIWITGRGEATSAPDLAILNLGIQALADTVAEARDQAATAMEGTVAALRANGIAERDIQTAYFNISPRYTSREITRCPSSQTQSSSGQTAPAVAPMIAVASQPEPAAASEPEPIVIVQEVADRSALRADEDCYKERESVIVGYQVNNQLTVKVRDLDSVGVIIDQVTEAGGNLTRFQGLSFTIEDNNALQVEARAAAIADLLDKSGQVATLTGVELGQLVYITESGSPVQPQFRAELAFATSAAAAPTAISPGELTVVVTMQAMFEIQPSGS